MKTVYLFNEFTGDYLGTYEAQESPLEPGVYIMPHAATEVAPPAHGIGDKLGWNGIAWVILPTPPVPPGPTFAELRAAEISAKKDLRDKMCARLASIASRFAGNADPTTTSSCNAVATDLLNLFTDPAVVAATDIATFKAALQARYNAAVALASPTAKAEFARYDR
jgi:hypothetical protein